MADLAMVSLFIIVKFPGAEEIDTERDLRVFRMQCHEKI